MTVSGPADELAELEIVLGRRPHPEDADSELLSAELRVERPGSDAQERSAADGMRLDLARLRELRDEPDAYGRLLTDTLFADPKLFAAFVRARTSAERLRVRLSFAAQAGTLQSLRWETLRDPAQRDAWLLGDPTILFSRCLASGDGRRVRVRSQGSLRAVAVVASPLDLSKRWSLAAIDVQAELARIRTHLAGIECVEVVTIPELVPPRRASLVRLREALRTSPDIVYFYCHGRVGLDGEAALFLEDDHGEAALIRADALVQALTGIEQRPALVVLGSCEGAGSGEDAGAEVSLALGPRLADAGIPAVLAMQGRVYMRTMAEFMPAFLRELSRDGIVDRAVAVARAGLADVREAWRPALFMRLRTGQIWTERTQSTQALALQSAQALAPAAGSQTIDAGRQAIEVGRELAQLGTPPTQVQVIDALQEIVKPPENGAMTTATSGSPTTLPARRWRAWATLAAAAASVLPVRCFVCGGPSTDPAGQTTAVGSNEPQRPPEEPESQTAGSTATKEEVGPPLTPSVCTAPDGMVCVVGGPFNMGSTDKEKDEAIGRCTNPNKCREYIDREDLREVTVETYILDRHEVTTAEYEAWLDRTEGLSPEPRPEPDGDLIDIKDDRGILLVTVLDEAQIANKSRIKITDRIHLLRGASGRFLSREGSRDLPLTLVTWHGADRYCRAAGKRLPSDVEWEYAARGAERRIFTWGADWPTAADCDRVVFGRHDKLPCSDRPRAPERRGPRKLDVTPGEAIFDLAGNVSEWVSTPHIDPEGCTPVAPTKKDPGRYCCADPEGSRRTGWSDCRVVRGGNWQGSAEALRGAGHSRWKTDAATFAFGFRCALSVEPEASSPELQRRPAPTTRKPLQ